jgi:hypothetical protein
MEPYMENNSENVSLYWIWSQSRGELYEPLLHKLVCRGYAGVGSGLNNPDMQHLKLIGPIPVGMYRIGPPEDGHGGYTLRLHPFKSNEMFGRSGFLIHAKLKSEANIPTSELTDHDGNHDGKASLGCICVDRIYRQTIWESDVHFLKVVP